jgi:UDP-N-acetylmuramoyl-tripeptide--D-alanyl-D-alanine ligase
MISLTVREIASVVSGTVFNLDLDMVITEYPVIDSRQATAGTFFVALQGENVDGADFVESAISLGSTFSLTRRESQSPSIVVDDPQQALVKLATYARIKSTECVFIGITGSQGKTTTKELVGNVLMSAGETVIPAGSFNNEIGLPLTILRCTDTTKFCVLEMGARHVGDIARLCEIAHPQVGAVLVVGSAHLGEFGDRAAIAHAKGELIENLAPGGSAILGTYDEFTPRMGEGRSDISRITFGESMGCTIRATDIEIREGRAHFDLVTPAGRSAVSLRILGAHQIANALAAASIATAVGISIETIAATLSTADISSKWRMELHDLGEYVIINDSYNANPESMAAALKTLSLFAQERGGSSWAFLGKMHELGESETQSHQEIGRLAMELGIDHLVAVGTDLYNVNTLGSAGMTLHQASDRDEAMRIAEFIEPGDSVLIKASRAEQLNLLSERIIEICSSRSGAIEGKISE